MNTEEKIGASVFDILNAVDVNDHTEKKNNLTYLSWVWAWAELKKRYPNATYTIYENEAGWNYHTDGRTCWVKTGVEVNGLEHIEYLPVMNFKNESIPVERVTSYDVNKAIQRSLTKAIARHGLGLYIYAAEDLPDTDQEAQAAPKKRASAPRKAGTPISGETLKQAQLLGIDLEKVAIYLKKDIIEITEAELTDCIERKRAALAKKAAEQVQPAEQAQSEEVPEDAGV